MADLDQHFSIQKQRPQPASPASSWQGLWRIREEQQETLLSEWSLRSRASEAKEFSRSHRDWWEIENPKSIQKVKQKQNPTFNRFDHISIGFIKHIIRLFYWEKKQAATNVRLDDKWTFWVCSWEAQSWVPKAACEAEAAERRFHILGSVLVSSLCFSPMWMFFLCFSTGRKLHVDILFLLFVP